MVVNEEEQGDWSPLCRERDGERASRVAARTGKGNLPAGIPPSRHYLTLLSVINQLFIHFYYFNNISYINRFR